MHFNTKTIFFVVVNTKQLKLLINSMKKFGNNYNKHAGIKCNNKGGLALPARHAFHNTNTYYIRHYYHYSPDKLM